MTAGIRCVVVIMLAFQLEVLRVTASVVRVAVSWNAPKGMDL